MRFVISTILAAFVVAGCSNPSDKDGSEAPLPETRPAAVSLPETHPAATPENVSVEIMDEARFADVLERRRGKVVLIDYWATWCKPCRELFPHAVELHRRLAAEGLVVIAISLDDPEDESKVQKWLTANGASFENYISRYGTGTRSAEVFDVPSGVPYLQLYDRDGEISRTFAAPIDPELVDKAIEELLAAP